MEKADKFQSYIELKHKTLEEAYNDALKGNKILSFVRLLKAKYYSEKASIPFSLDFYRRKLEKIYQSKGLEFKIKHLLCDIYLKAAQGSEEYKTLIDYALNEATYFNDPAKRNHYDLKIRSSLKQFDSVYNHIGLVKLKEKKAEEIKKYARRGDFVSMVRAIKEEPFKFSFSLEEKSEFYKIYEEEGSFNRIDFLLYSAKEDAKKGNCYAMLSKIKEAADLSKEVGIYEIIVTWIKSRNIKRIYINFLKEAKERNRLKKKIKRRK